MITDQELEKYLMDLESRLDDATEQKNLDEWLSFVNGKCNDFFTPSKRKPSPPRVVWPSIKINDAIADRNAMILQQFRGASNELEKGGWSRLNVRCNYGTGIIPDLFGCEVFMMPYETDTLPGSLALSADDLRRLPDRGVPDFRQGFGGEVFKTAEVFLSIMKKYPKIGKWVTLYHPDTQGPIDAAEVIWGSNIFYAFYDEPELVRSVLRVITDTMKKFLKTWFALVPENHPWTVHWGTMFKGRLLLRNDSLMNLSSPMYEEFVFPLDQELLDEFGGGAIHFCGRGDHYIEAMSKTRGLSGILMSQPYLNNLDVMFENTIKRGIKLVALDRKSAMRVDPSLRGLVYVCT